MVLCCQDFIAPTYIIVVSRAYILTKRSFYIFTMVLQLRTNVSLFIHLIVLVYKANLEKQTMVLQSCYKYTT